MPASNRSPTPDAAGEHEPIRPSLFERGQRAIASELDRRQALRSRTEGLAWMIWGLVLPLVFLSIEASGLLFERGPLQAYARGATGAYPAWIVLVWLPWVLAGTIAVRALWFNAVLGIPQLEPMRPRVWAVVLAWTAVVALVWGVLALLHPQSLDARGLLLGVGLAWVSTGLLGAFQATPRARQASVGVGLATLAAGVGATVFLPVWPAPGSLWASWIAAVVTAVCPYAGGLYLLVRADRASTHAPADEPTGAQ